LSSFSKNIGVYLLIILISILVVNHFFPAEETNAELAYTDFKNLVQQGEIREVTIIGKHEIEGTKADGTSFQVKAPDDPALIPFLEDNNVDISWEEPPEPPWWTALLSSVFPVLILIAAWIFIMHQMQGGGNRVMSFGKNKAREYSNEKGRVTFSDVAGADEAKEELVEVVDFLENPQKFIKLGAEIPKGVLLVGPPGTGKTLLGRAIAGEAGVPFYSISGSDFVEMFVGVGASRVRDLFKQAKENSPCIVFMDEIDAVGRQRGAGLGGGHDEREQTLNQLLVEMDGFETNEGIILLAATNRPDVLDPALLRPGRFDRRVIVDRPDYKGRKEILSLYIKDKPIDDSIDVDVLARRTPGFTGADIENLVNEAAILAARKNKEVIEMQECEEAIDRVIAGPAKKSAVMNEKELNITAYHEAGHTVVAQMLDNVDNVHKVSIIPRGQAGGFTMTLPDEDRKYMTKSQLIGQIAFALGGRAAEKLFIDEISTGAQNDLERSTKMARKMVTEYGMSENLGPRTFGEREENPFLGRELTHNRDYSEEVAAVIDDEVRTIIEDCYSQALNLLEENREELEELVAELKRNETLDGDQINQILGIETEDKEIDEELKVVNESEREFDTNKEGLSTDYRENDNNGNQVRHTDEDTDSSPEVRLTYEEEDTDVECEECEDSMEDSETDKNDQ